MSFFFFLKKLPGSHSEFCSSHLTVFDAYIQRLRDFQFQSLEWGFRSMQHECVLQKRKHSCQLTAWGCSLKTWQMVLGNRESESFPTHNPSSSKKDVCAPRHIGIQNKTRDQMFTVINHSFILMQSLWELEKWLSGYEHILLLQRTLVPFSAPTSGQSQPPVIPAPADLTSLASIMGTYTHVYIPLHTHTHKYIQLKIIKSRSWKKSLHKHVFCHFLVKTDLHTRNMNCLFSQIRN